MDKQTLNQLIKNCPNRNHLDDDNPNIINIKIFDNIYYTMLEKSKRDINISNLLKETLIPVLWNIKNQEHIFYKTETIEEQRQYFTQYLNNINNILSSFNALLLKCVFKICKKNNIKYYGKDIENISDHRNNHNSMKELLSFLNSYFKNNVPFFKAYEVIFFNNILYLSLYETIYRHQLSHGWHDTFFYFFSSKYNIDDFEELKSYLLTNKEPKKTNQLFNDRIFYKKEVLNDNYSRNIIFNEIYSADENFVIKEPIVNINNLFISQGKTFSDSRKLSLNWLLHELDSFTLILYMLELAEENGINGNGKLTEFIF